MPPPIPLSTLSLAFQAVSLQLAGRADADPQAALRTAIHLVRGFCAGAQGDAFIPPQEVRAPAHPVSDEWEAFLRKLRSKELTSRGILNEGAEACAIAFLTGAIETFPEAETKVFLATLGRVWGVRMSPAQRPLTAPVSEERLKFSREVGRLGGERLRSDYEAGRLGGLGKTVLDHKLHLRNVGDYLEASGWLMGTVAFLKSRFPERGELIARNHASIVHRAFHGGNLRYPEEVVEALPSLLQSLDLEIARWASRDPDAAGALRTNRDTILSRALHSGDLNYPHRATKAIPEMLKTLDDQGTHWEAGNMDAANALRANRASIVSRALNQGNFDYPGRAASRVPAIFQIVDREIARLDPFVSKTARLLEANRATIVMRALANGDFNYAEEAIKELPRLRQALEREISRLAVSDPEAAQLLRANRASVIARSLNSGDWDYPKKVAKELPSLIKTLDPAHRASAVHSAILMGALSPVRES